MAFWNKEEKKEDLTPGLGKVKHVVAIASGKGGVGKSTVSTNLAIALKTRGFKVGLMDADIYGPSQPGMLGAFQEKAETTPENFLIPVTCHGLKFVSMGLLMPEDAPVVWRAPMAMKVIHQFIGNVIWGDLDYLLIDLPPGTGDVQLTLAQQSSLSGAIIVTTPQDVALGIAKKGLRMFEQVNVPILGIVENMSGFVCGHCGTETSIFKGGGAAQMAQDLEVPFLGKLPLDPEIMASGDEGTPILIKNRESQAAQAYLDLAKNVEGEIARQSEVLSDQPKDVKAGPEGQLLITWPEGNQDALTPYHLRVNCRCAVCIDENTGKKLLDPKKVPLDIRIKSVDQVGRYALGIQFSDGHQTGIYTFESLKKLGSTGSQSPQEESFSV